MGKPLANTIIRSPGGIDRHTVLLNEVNVPDLWRAKKVLEKKGYRKTAEDVYECWCLCHDLLKNLRGETERRGS